jgi:hypothetical protein
LTLRPAGQSGAVHVSGTATHRRAGVDVLRHRGLGEALRCDDHDLAGIDVILGSDAEDTAEMVDVAMAVDHGNHRSVTAVLPVEIQRGCRCLGRDQRVDHDHPVSPSTKLTFDRSSPRT